MFVVFIYLFQLAGSCYVDIGSRYLRFHHFPSNGIWTKYDDSEYGYNPCSFGINTYNETVPSRLPCYGATLCYTSWTLPTAGTDGEVMGEGSTSLQAVTNVLIPSSTVLNFVINEIHRSYQFDGSIMVLRHLEKHSGRTVQMGLYCSHFYDYRLVMDQEIPSVFSLYARCFCTESCWDPYRGNRRLHYWFYGIGIVAGFLIPLIMFLACYLQHRKSHSHYVVLNNRAWPFDDLHFNRSSQVAEDFLVSSDDLTFIEELNMNAHSMCWKVHWNGRNVLAKKLRYSMLEIANQSYIHGFANDISLLRPIQHKRLAEVLGICLDLDYCYILIELAEHGSILDYMRLHNEVVGWNQRLRWATATVDGLKFLHKRKVLHRSLKASNILLDQNLNVKLTDFGVRKALLNLRKKCQIEDKGGLNLIVFDDYVRYSAPEIIRNPGNAHSYTSSSDVYALGICFWQLITLQIPFADMQDGVEIADAIICHGFNVATNFSVELPYYRETVIGCLGYTPEERPTLRQIKDQLRKSVKFITGRNALPVGIVVTDEMAPLVHQGDHCDMLCDVPMSVDSSRATTSIVPISRRGDGTWL